MGYKIKMNFYRVPSAEFEDNYMIRLVKNHFLFPKTTYLLRKTSTNNSSYRSKQVIPSTKHKVNPKNLKKLKLPSKQNKSTLKTSQNRTNNFMIKKRRLQKKKKKKKKKPPKKKKKKKKKKK